jgi:hypothetical protein
MGAWAMLAVAGPPEAGDNRLAGEEKVLNAQGSSSS